MPIIHVHIVEGRSEEKKKRMARRVSEAVAETLDAPLETIRVLVHEISSDDWHVGGISKSDRDHENNNQKN